MDTLRRSQLTPGDRQRKQRMGLARSVAMLLGLVVLAVWFALADRSPEVISMTMAKSLDANYKPIEPVSTFGPDDTFFVSVELRRYRAGEDLTALWRYEGQEIAQTPLSTDDSGSGYAGFSIAPEDPPQWPEGSYVVDIMYEGHVLGRAAFEVAADG